MPPDFKPTPHSVVVGRSKECKEAVGNRRLNVLASMFLSKYCDSATKKREKSSIVSTIAQMVHEACPNGGAFIKRGGDGRWIEMDDRGAREKVGSVFRDLLHAKYRSSSKSKTAKRRQLRMAQRRREGYPGATNSSRIDSMSDSDSSLSSSIDDDHYDSMLESLVLPCAGNVVFNLFEIELDDCTLPQDEEIFNINDIFS